jgi:creatinine amidohydrolase
MIDTAGGWAERTAEEVQEIGASTGSIVVVPVGSVEQHGAHLPVITDTLLVSRVVQASIEQLGQTAPVLDTPPVWLGCSEHHLDFGGTLSVGRETLLAVLEDVADTALENGFDGLVLVNGHGGNKPAIGCAVNDIGAQHPDVTVSGLTYFDLAAEVVPEVRDSDTGGMAHGGEFETSLLLHLAPEVVRTDQLEDMPLDEPAERGLSDMFEPGPLQTYRPFAAYSDSGAIGTPTKASAEKGERLFDAIVAELVDTIRQMHERMASDVGERDR